MHAAPPPLNFDHLGVVVPSLAEGRNQLAATLQIVRWTAAYDDPGIGVSVQFGADANGGPTMELIAPLGDKSPIANALRKGTRILSHVAYTTPDIGASAAHLLEQGCASTGPAHPAVAYAGRRVQFFISPLRFMIELIEGSASGEYKHVFLDAYAETGA